MQYPEALCRQQAGREHGPYAIACNEQRLLEQAFRARVQDHETLQARMGGSQGSVSAGIRPALQLPRHPRANLSCLHPHNRFQYGRIAEGRIGRYRLIPQLLHKTARYLLGKMDKRRRQGLKRTSAGGVKRLSDFLMGNGAF